MKSISTITKDNFSASFNIIDILHESVFYPASGLDATPIEVFANKYKSYINLDYSLSFEEVKNSLESDFISVGYKLIGIKDVSKEELTPNGITYSMIAFTDHEIQRLENNEEIKDLFTNASSSGFAIWAVYELDANLTHKIDEKAERFSILHICGEGWATFEALYVKNKINPKAVAIIKPGEGYGDNWTLFTDSRFRFYQSIRENEHINGAEMPKFILTDAVSDEGYFWGEYALSKDFSECSLYELEK